MTVQTWREIALEWVEPWIGMLDTSGYFVVRGGEHANWYGSDGDGDFEFICEPCPDLTHPPTAREAVARLALFLGAPKEAAAEGVLFYNDIRNGGGGAWVIEAGCGPDWSFMFDLDYDDIPANQRPLAIALAWRAARESRP